MKRIKWVCGTSKLKNNIMFVRVLQKLKIQVNLIDYPKYYKVYQVKGIRGTSSELVIVKSIYLHE